MSNTSRLLIANKLQAAHIILLFNTLVVVEDDSSIILSYFSGGFPISGEFLVCQNPELYKRHPAKIYGKAAVGAPPMSVPHLDARVIDGKQMLLFGPYAGFSPKYLKTGSYSILLYSCARNNNCACGHNCASLCSL